MFDRSITFVAMGLGVGRIPVAPGTAGSILGLGYWCLLTRIPNPQLYWVAVVAGIAVAVWCSGQAARGMGETDPPRVVIDEIVAVPLAMSGQELYWKWWAILLALILFRAFDVWKPLYIRELQKLPGGWGIVLDDLAAAVCACVSTWIIVIAALLIFDLGSAN